MHNYSALEMKRRYLKIMKLQNSLRPYVVHSKKSNNATVHSDTINVLNKFQTTLSIS